MLCKIGIKAATPMLDRPATLGFLDTLHERYHRFNQNKHLKTIHFQFSVIITSGPKADHSLTTGSHINTLIYDNI